MIKQPKTEWIDNQEPLTDQATEDKQLIRLRADRDKASDASESGRITTNWPDDWPNNWLNTSTSTSTPLRSKLVRGLSGSGARGLEPARGQEPTTEALKI